MEKPNDPELSERETTSGEEETSSSEEKVTFPTNGQFPGTLTITFGECVENHVGNEQIGEKRKEKDAYSVEDLLEVSDGIPNSEVYILEYGGEKAALLYVPNGVELFSTSIDDLEREHMGIINKYDQKAWMRQQQGVVQKKARFNICITDEPHEADYENKKGTVLSFEDVPLLGHIRDNLHLAFGEKAKGLYAEGNHYYNPQSCGIGWHGDTERSIVLAIRMGEPMNLKYQWYYEGKEVPGGDFELTLNRGDMYLMSYKATGNDWKRRVVPTLRHSAGCPFYTSTESQKEAAKEAKKAEKEAKKAEKETKKSAPAKEKAAAPARKTPAKEKAAAPARKTPAKEKAAAPARKTPAKEKKAPARKTKEPVVEEEVKEEPAKDEEEEVKEEPAKDEEEEVKEEPVKKTKEEPVKKTKEEPVAPTRKAANVVSAAKPRKALPTKKGGKKADVE